MNTTHNTNTQSFTPTGWDQCKPEYISLFEYLGKAAGRELGTQIRKTAMVHGVQVDKRIVNNRNYKGNVTLYPKAWLDTWFKLYQPIKTTNT